MLCSGKELELPDDVDGLLVLPADAPLGTPLAEYLRLDDAILEVNVTPNRGDCFSVLGIAREIAARDEGAVANRERGRVPAPSRCAIRSRSSSRPERAVRASSRRVVRGAE